MKKKNMQHGSQVTHIAPYAGVMLKLCTASFSASDAFLFSLSLSL